MKIEIVGKSPMPLWEELQKKYGAKSLINEYSSGWNLELECDSKTLLYLRIKYSNMIKFNVN
tara:strand:+ start:28 stop:213 length:186 start_codon:yes stop_codon:yes gene_type:complete